MTQHRTKIHAVLDVTVESDTPHAGASPIDMHSLGNVPMEEVLGRLSHDQLIALVTSLVADQTKAASPRAIVSGPPVPQLPSELVLIRHGTTPANREDQAVAIAVAHGLKCRYTPELRGMTDPSQHMDELGRRQAAASAPAILAILDEVDIVITSDYRRACEVLEIVLAQAAPARAEAILRKTYVHPWAGERVAGENQFRTLFELSAVKRERIERESKFRYSAAGGQSSLDLTVQIFQLLQWLAWLKPGAKVAIVAHSHQFNCHQLLLTLAPESEFDRRVGEALRSIEGAYDNIIERGTLPNLGWGRLRRKGNGPMYEVVEWGTKAYGPELASPTINTDQLRELEELLDMQMQVSDGQHLDASVQVR